MTVAHIHALFICHGFYFMFLIKMYNDMTNCLEFVCDETLLRVAANNTVFRRAIIDL